ncbi:hypothetical protein [Virgibacillus oceani]|uniref:Uncharacterized protein n=1 Tax=Virgibacillus oceani TaxID=1479511 RepID=A0A917HU51_9BACI|nr:hypothetical protein [Virgibacillus oceani]GGG88662.1 hypothetical protein GCM10011398_38330 [Virgibacillus oceani]
MQLSQPRRNSFTKTIQIGLKNLTNPSKKSYSKNQVPAYDQYKLSDDTLTEYKSKIGFYR